MDIGPPNPEDEMSYCDSLLDGPVPRPSRVCHGSASAPDARAQGVPRATAATGACKKGDDGEKGSVGVRGFTGGKGDRGYKGAKGDTGVEGPHGGPGPQGEAGACPESCEVVQGPAGDAGLPGKTGVRGVPGQKGSRGDKGDKGDIGDIGPIGVPGSDGTKGEQGAEGECNCHDGESGVDGPKGSTGLKGNKGDIGSSGGSGRPGIKGQQGDLGDMGMPGIPGPCTPVMKSAFCAALTRSYPAPNNPVAFPRILYNIQMNYNPENGVYRAPVNGTYVFSYNVIAFKKVLKVGLFHNFMPVVKTTEPTELSTASQNVVLHMNMGDMAWLQVKNELTNGMYTSDESSSTFCGFLLFPDNCDLPVFSRNHFEQSTTAPNYGWDAPTTQTP
ncbi:hypothetical protein AAFF_G00303930 [Aldrovandia affinis]|uniref:C1q domain-containing protein n=1 Tax=Aldrovandia affinis TaxID=143900 RepID=A0AAD7SQA0_9TELE|nr:hypothetical protein AAFF_G00303930 [Aldrovandia affinis]